MTGGGQRSKLRARRRTARVSRALLAPGSAREGFTHAKLYRRSFFDDIIAEGVTFEGFAHVDDWVRQRLVTATGPNPLPRGPGFDRG